MRMPNSKDFNFDTSSISTVRASLLLIGLLLCWSLGFLGMRFSIDHGSPSLIVFWRCAVGGLLLLPFALLIGPRLCLRDVLNQAVIGVFAMAGYMGGCFLAIDRGVPTGVVALISDLLPLAIVLLSIPILGQRISPKEWLGIALAVIGVLVASCGSLEDSDAPAWAYALPALGMVSMAAVTLLQKRWKLANVPIHQSLCIQMLSTSLVFLLACCYEGRVSPPINDGFWIGVAWMIVIGTFGSYGIYYVSVRDLSPTIVSNVLYLSPPVAMIWAWVLFEEPLSFEMILGLVITLLGVMLVSRQGRTAKLSQKAS